VARDSARITGETCDLKEIKTRTPAILNESRFRWCSRLRGRL